ncbi:MAG: hypothetical protein H5U36_09785 [Candidatus Caldatribacterium sp.]|nr:hypothetical protein [Candidatus Caldatribacterium sp.]
MRKSFVFLLVVVLVLFSSIAHAEDREFFELFAVGTPQDVQRAIEEGVDVNARDKSGATLLMWAAMLNENPEVVRVLLEAGADATLTNSLGKKAIDYARENPALKDTDVFWELYNRSF